ncbi:MAG: SDR family NAD(P)-dependent oxidoreductase [Myxococcales bacterium]|nr:SDR family NAD(P)-dependent oxidoreductase [Myxococcales bacterium]
MKHTLAMKKVLVTGGTRGIGRALAETLSQRGCEVMVCGRSRAALTEVERSLGVRTVRCDVTSAADIAALRSAVQGELCGLDLLVNNAGLQLEHDLVDALDVEAARRETEVNLLAPMLVTDALLPLLLAAPDAAVVNVTSALALAPAPRAPVYSAAKAGLSAYTHALRAQLAESTVRVVEVVPPLTRTAMTAGRDDGAVEPQVVAEAIARGLERGKQRLVIGKARALSAIFRVSPALARCVMRGR